MVFKERESLNVYTRANITRDIHTRHKESNVGKDLIFLWGKWERHKGGFPRGGSIYTKLQKKSIRVQQCRLGHSRQKKGTVQSPEV